jgi:protein Tex
MREECGNMINAKLEAHQFVASKMDSSVPEKSIVKTLELLSEGATIPFIARYRKEATGGLDEVQIAWVRDQGKLFKAIEDRKVTILSSIEEQGKLTDALRHAIVSSYDLGELEDYYLPYKQKRKTKADTARENGLEGLAKWLSSQQHGDPVYQAERFVKGAVQSTEEALEGALHIVAEWVSEHIALRNQLRKVFRNQGMLTTKLMKGKEEEAQKYKDYFAHTELLKRCPSHRFLAIYRGQKEGFLKIKVAPEKELALQLVERFFVKGSSPASELVRSACKDAYDRLLSPSLENEWIQEKKVEADTAAIKVFTKNLEQLLLAPPLGQKRILAIDPGYRTGCKIVCLDELGNLLTNTTIYPHAPQKEMSAAKSKLAQLVQSYKIEAIAVGDGTAGRETESMLKHIHFDREVVVFVVREDGASVYSASSVARKEFPDYDITVRGAVSIGRRLMDPLAELVKIDPKSIGVGQYQHEVDQHKLKDALDDVIVSCVNRVGVDVNTASPYLLSHVSGLGPQLADNIVTYRSAHGSFQAREELKKVKRLGNKAFEQCAGFLRIKDAKNPLDNSAVHPESYTIVARMAKQLNVPLLELVGNNSLLEKLNPVEFAEVDRFTFEDICHELAKPGRDPRKAAKIFEFDSSIRTIEDLKTGMLLPGIVTNVTSFGAFVNIGIKENGLIHKSHLSDSFVADPSEVIALHQHVQTRVITVDLARKRIGLALVK